MNKTTKKEIIERVVNATNLTHTQASRTLEAIVSAIADTLVAGGEVRIKGFGRLSVVKTAPRKARDIRNGNTIEVPAKKKVSFKPSLSLRTNINKLDVFLHDTNADAED